MFTVQEICEEQERQYNQLMKEDDQYCHPESFKWGFEHGVEYALTKLGWRPASELPPEEGEYIVISDEGEWSDLFYAEFKSAEGWCSEIEGYYVKIKVKLWFIHQRRNEHEAGDSTNALN